MITEIAQIDVKPGTEKDFEAAVAKARAAFGRSKGFHGFWRELVGQLFCVAARGRTHSQGSHHRKLNGNAASGRHRFRRGVVSLEMLDHDLCDRYQRQGERQPPDAEHDAQQDLERK